MSPYDVHPYSENRYNIESTVQSVNALPTLAIVVYLIDKCRMHGFTNF